MKPINLSSTLFPPVISHILLDNRLQGKGGSSEHASESENRGDAEGRGRAATTLVVDRWARRNVANEGEIRAGDTHTTSLVDNNGTVASEGPNARLGGDIQIGVLSVVFNCEQVSILVGQ